MNGDASDQRNQAAGQVWSATFADPSDCECAFGGTKVQAHCHRQRRVQGANDVAALSSSAYAPWLRGIATHRLCVVAAVARLCFLSDWRGTPDMGRDRVAAWRYRLPQPRQSECTSGQPERGDGALCRYRQQQLASCSKSLIGRKITWPLVGRVLQPQPIATRRLLRLHARAAGLAEAKDKLLDQPEFVQTLEQELLLTLVECLTVDDPGRDGKKRRTSRQYHGPVRECTDGPCRPSTHYFRDLRLDRRAGTNFAGMLRRIPGRESDQISSLAASEYGAIRTKTSGSGQHECGRDCPSIPVLRTWSFRRKLSHDLRRDAFDDAAKH